MDAHDLELWAGPECTINRVRNVFHDQFARYGHDARAQDIDLLATLGARQIRYPIQWERVSPDSPDCASWNWIEPRLERLRASALAVIAGLVHHGSGPAYTNLLDDSGFATGLARHARRVAERFPWIESYTPVNEPLTTARFSALYGHWYPHARDERSFWRALLNQVDGTRLAMAAIRSVNPCAKLIQTDDLGKTYGSAAMRQQTEFDNLRRWAGWDLLCGRVTREHPLWAEIAAFGLESRLDAIAGDPCTPDVIGINHYLTSDRFLDHRLDRYPVHTHGGNGRQRYADVEAIRIREPAPGGLAGALREAWDRYRLPVAVTEVHNGCTREEQMRWVAEAWDTALAMRSEGVDVRAVTIWSVFGSCDWNTLLTAKGNYESGVFDVRGSAPRATALAGMIQGLSRGAPRHPVAQAAGWWRRTTRLLYPPVGPPQLRAYPDNGAAQQASRPPLLILGATGSLGRAFARACVHRSIEHVLLGRADMELRDPDSIARALDRYRPWAVINAAGWVRVDDAEARPDDCREANTEGPIRLGVEAAARGISTVNFSSDLVFDGRAEDSYVETDLPSPLGIYGESKARMEEGIAALPGRHLVVRSAAFFSALDIYNFAHAVAAAGSRGERLRAAHDLVVSPTYLPHLIDAALDLVIDGEQGLWHLTNATPVSWAAFGAMIANDLGLPSGSIEPVAARDLGFIARRPAFVPLRSIKGVELPSLGLAVSDFAARWRSTGMGRCAEVA